MSKHTPGAWRWMNGDTLVGDHGSRPVILAPTLESLGGYPMLGERCELSGRLKRVTGDSPNARIIAASPTMKEALEEVSLLVSYALEENPDCDWKEILEMIGKKSRDAIAKAEGKK